MATIQTPINVGTTAVQVVGGRARRGLWIQSYSTGDFGGNASMFVAFGKVATAGSGGELEITAGGVYVFGASGSVLTFGELPVCPTEYISIITISGTALGAITEFP